MELNILAILTAAVSSVLIGYVWYSPLFFAKTWSKLSGLSDRELEINRRESKYIINLTAAVLEAMVLAIILKVIQVDNLADGFKTGFMLWSGFIVTTHLTNSLFAKKPLKLFLIDNGQHLAAILMMSLILTIWR